MMTIPMDNSVDNPTREHAQRLFKQNAELEYRRRKAAQARIPSDPNAWQQMRENFQAIILEDHVFSEQHEIEFALWQLHYRRIEELRATYNSASVASASQNEKGLVRGGSDRVTKIRCLFKTFLTESTGFYHDLMSKIRAKYGLPLDYLSMLQDGNKLSDFKKGLLSCHRCFIYLGDLARYKGLYGDGDSKALDFSTSSSYYMQAISIWPSRGNPHHQLAILATYSGDELVAIYRYFRSLAAEIPFVTARDNLIIAFEKNRQSYSQLFGGTKPASTICRSARTTARGRSKGDTRLQTKDTRSERNSSKDTSCDLSMTLKSFNVRFIRLNGILFTRTSLETFEEVFSVVRRDFLKLISSRKDEEHNFGTEASDCRLAIVRLVAILIFSIHNVNRETDNPSNAEILQRSVLLENAFSATFELVGLMINHCSTMNDLSISYLLPGIMVFIEWLACNQDVAVGSDVEEKQANARLFFWNSCIIFLNKIISRGHVSVDFGNMTRYEEGDDNNTANRVALPEDFELRGFLPVLPAQVILDFSGKYSYENDGNKESNARMKRVLAAGKALANVVVRIGDQKLYFDSKLKKFSIGQDFEISNDNTLSTLENPIVGRMNVDISQPKPPLQVEDEDEDEDEVIVFKPLMAEKKDESMFKKPYSSEMMIEPKVSMVNATDSFSNGVGLYTTSRPPLLSEQQAMENGLTTRLTFPESGPTLNQDSFPLQLPANNDGNNYSVTMSQKFVVPSKFDSIMYPVTDNNLPTKISSVTAKKTPVSRPVRYTGPPPGFGSVPSKTIEESLSALSLKAEKTGIINQMDDYRWLDGYNFQPENKNVGFNGSVSTSGSIGSLDFFPFPGKQVTSLQPAIENMNGWSENHLSEQLKLYQEQNQQPAVQNRQYQGQSLWNGFL